MITVNLYYTGSNGSARAFAEEMVGRGIAAAIRAEEGNLRYEYFFPMNDPETVLLIDQWRDQTAIDAHHASPMMAQIAALREKYDLHMKVERFVSDDAPLPEADRRFIRKLKEKANMSKKITRTAGRNQLGEFAPLFARLNDDVLFGEVWNEQAIDVKTKCIVTVVALMASGITDSSLGYHLQNARNNGVTKEEIAAVITHATMYVGWPKGWAVFRQAKEIWNDDYNKL